MLDVNFIRKNQTLIEHSAREKGYQIDISSLLELDDKRKNLLQQVESLRQQRNQLSAKMKGGKPSAELLEQAKTVKTQLAKVEPELSEVEANLTNQLKQVPNIIFDDVPLGSCRCKVLLP